jgi:hypothetical protein
MFQQFRRKILSQNLFEWWRWKRFFKLKFSEWRDYPKIFVLRVKANNVFKLNWNKYHWITSEDILRTRKSDTLFIFGSGFSLNQISQEEWDKIQKHETMGFNWFNNQNFVRCDYYLIREIITFSHEFSNPFAYIRKFKRYGRLFEKEFYRNTTFILQNEWKAISSKYFSGLGFLPEKARIYPYRSIGRGQLKKPTKNLKDGLVHGPCTLVECINFGLGMGYKNIVLTGVDLYDERYFWLPYNKTRPECEAKNLTANDVRPNFKWILGYFKFAKKFYDQMGVKVTVYNPKSLLNEVFPVFNWNDHEIKSGTKSSPKIPVG